MKWFLCALCCLTEGLSVLRAQIMPDSSVQICAYWTPGDKYAYEAREEKFKIDDQGDTTLVYRQSERRVFEILSQTKDRYKIRLTYGDYMTTDKEDQLVHDAIVSATGPCVVEFETDETGSLLGIANLETLVAQAEASVEPAVRVMWETIPSAERKNFPKKNFRKYMARTLSDPSVVINAVNDDLGRMFFSMGHGSIRRRYTNSTRRSLRCWVAGILCGERLCSGLTADRQIHTVPYVILIRKRTAAKCCPRHSDSS